MKVDGIWALVFVPLPGQQLARESGGIVVLQAGRISGGDTWSYYSGAYEITHSLVVFRVKTGLHYAKGAQSIFGGPLGEFSFLGKGLIDGAMRTIDATLVVEGRPELKLMARLTFACDLPDSSDALRANGLPHEVAQ